MLKKGLVVYIDPYNLKEGAEAADIILITHPHYDHCSLNDIQRILKKETAVIGPVDVQSKVAKLGDIMFHMMNPGNTLSIKGVSVTGFPAYNIGKEFHPRHNGWLGYLIEIAGVKLYHAGDTDATPELKQLKGIDVLMLPVGGTFTMDADEAASVANTVMPKLAIPMHYGAIIGTKSDAERFEQLTRCLVKKA